ncbi:tripartite tricarboxylate transporter substrate binding protein [Pusillimonas sp. MFBS29]|uniref:tripartite tricarboxylate transporter substrate binding protein n=1 Tax=Pusillimonas sp. MFBS29 TaxID=2886690 RepID=UPI001D120C7C|nr:tripartite tricarboxylate transporter substrate binding protein [Pusillimonas sp. MFBS29]MCC2595613.1 tripartite tricarboxylate transporter substrate binding protein [Pusillimonas sp. MFBS29]
MASLGLFGPVYAQTNDFPKRAVTLVIPQGPGSGSDMVGRMLAEFMAPKLGQTVIVENRPGAGGVIAHQSVKREAADGYTVLFSSTAQLLIVPILNPAANYTLKDFTPVAPLMWAPFAVLVANTPDAPNSIQELVDIIRSRPTAYSSSGIGNMTHLGSESFLRRAGVQSTHVPYQGSGASLTDLMGGQVLFSVDSLTASMTHIKSGKLKALAVTGEAREASLPDVPTLNEAGLAGPPIGVLGGLFAPAGVPDQAIGKIKASVEDALNNPRLLERFAATETAVLKLSNDEFLAKLREQAPYWEGLVSELDLQIK